MIDEIISSESLSTHLCTNQLVLFYRVQDSLRKVKAVRYSTTVSSLPFILFGCVTGDTTMTHVIHHSRLRTYTTHHHLVKYKNYGIESYPCPRNTMPQFSTQFWTPTITSSFQHATNITIFPVLTVHYKCKLTFLVILELFFYNTKNPLGKTQITEIIQQAKDKSCHQARMIVSAQSTFFAVFSDFFPRRQYRSTKNLQNKNKQLPYITRAD